MWGYFVIVTFFLILELARTDLVSNRYCDDMKPQSFVRIQELQGMWYGVEIISHKANEERLGIQHVDSCLIIHISEDNTPYYQGGGGGGQGTYPYTPPSYQPSPTYQDNWSEQQQQQQWQQNEYNRVQGSFGSQNQDARLPHRHSTYYQGRNYGPDEYPRRNLDERRLRLLWEEDGGYVEYNIRYNFAKSGFWKSSGPQNGSSLDPQFDKFAGTIQVIKAVGNHLVLNFCHQLPDQSLFTVVLSRVPRLTRNELSEVHDLLIKRGLETHNIKRVCGNSAHGRHLTLSILIIAMTHFLFRIIKSSC